MARPDYGSLSKSHVDHEEKFEFWHTHFHRHTPERLHLVQRRVSQLVLVPLAPPKLFPPHTAVGLEAVDNGKKKYLGSLDLADFFLACWRQ